jgi:formate dehydrogenase
MGAAMSNLEPAPASGLPEPRNPALRDQTRSVSTYCRICEAGCGLIAELDGDHVVRVRPNSRHAHSRGFACNKPQALLELLDDPDRITFPMVRNGGPGEFTRVTWDEALDLCAARLASVRGHSGPEAVAVLRGNPPYFDSGGVLWGRGFSGALGVSRTYTVNSEDAASRLTANEALYGQLTTFPRPDLWHTELVMIMGANPLEARSTRLSEPQTREAFDSVIARGGRVLVVDPRRTATAERYEHISIRPGTDPWFLMGISKLLCEDADAGTRVALGAPVAGFEEFAGLARTFDVEECASRSGTDVLTLASVAEAFRIARSATIYGGTGTCAQRFGTLSNILQDTVVALTGNVDRRGGFLLGWAAIDLTPTVPGPKAGTRRSPAEGRPEVAGALPSSALAADITMEGPGRIRAVVIVGNNSVLSSGGGGARLERALQELDFSVGMDIYMNETNRYADVLLPVTTMFERGDYPLTIADTQLRPTSYATRAVIPPRGEARDAWWIFDEISRRMGLGGSCPDKELERELEQCGERPTPRHLIDRLLSRGSVPWLTFEALADEHPNGVPLLESLPVGRLTDKLLAPHSRVDLFSVALRSEVERLRRYEEPAEEWPLRMIGRREKGSQNTTTRSGSTPRATASRRTSTRWMQLRAMRRMGTPFG